MAAGVRDVLTVVAVAALVLFTNLGGYPLFDEDEPKNAVCGMEMFQRGDWIVPTFNQDLRTDKPILIYWLMLCSFNVFGVSEFSARFGSSLLSLGTALGTYYLGRKLYDRQVGLLAGVVIVTCLMFSAVGRAVTPDATLVFCLTWCFCGFVACRGWKVDSSSPIDSPFQLFAIRYSLFALFPMYALMGLAMLAKGPVGFLLPCTAIGLFGLCASLRNDLSSGRVTLTGGSWWMKSLQFVAALISPVRFLKTLWSMKLWVGIPVAFNIALPWYLAVGTATNGAWLQGFLYGHNIDRFLQAKENHWGTVMYYLPVLLAGTFPWSIFLPTAVIEIWRRIRTGAARSESDLFLACWAMTWLVFFSLAATKLPNYILPIYPAVAVIVSRSLIGWTRSLAGSERKFLLECRLLTVMGLLMMGGILIAMSILIPTELTLALLGVIPVITGVVASRLAQRQQRVGAIISCAAGAVLLAVCLTGGAPVALARYQDSPYFAQTTRQSTTHGASELATFQVFEPSLVFYHGRRIHCPQNADDVTRYFETNADGRLLTRSDRLDQLPPELAGELVELARQRRFLRRHDLVLLGKPPMVAAEEASLRR